MTTTTETMPSTDAVLAQLEHDLGALPGEEKFQRPLDDLRQQRAVLENHIVTIRTATTALANVEPRIAADTKWLDELTTWRKTLCDELCAAPPRPRTDLEHGRIQNLRFSIQSIDRGIGVLADTGWSLETLRLGELMMREASYVESARIENQIHGSLPWFGSLPETERRLKELQLRRDVAQAQLDDALLDPAERERRAAERKATFDATPQRKTRGDGSQFDRYPDGREVEVTS